MQSTAAEIKSYILSEDVMKELKRPVAKQRKHKKVAPKVTYDVVLQADCDFIIEKRKGKTLQQLVILVSQKQYYLQTAEGKRELLRVTNLREYLNDVEDEIMLPEVTWLSGLKPGREFARSLVKAIQYDDSVNMIRRKLYYLYEKEDCSGYDVHESHRFWHAVYDFPHNDILITPVLNLDNWTDDDFTFSSQEEVEDDWGDIFDTGDSVATDSNMSCCYDMRELRRKSYSDIIEDCFCCSSAFYAWIIGYMAQRRNVTRKELFQKYLFEVESKEKKVIQSYFAFLAIDGLMGMEWAKKAVVLYMDSGVEDILPVNQICGMYIGDNCFIKCNAPGYYRGLRCKRKFKAESFLQYLFVEAVKQGFADDLQRFLFIWNDVLTKQEELDGKIKEKYPEHLVSFQCELAYESRKYQSRIKERRWNKAVNNMQPYEYKNEEYQIVSPKNMTELMMEGRNQHNCVYCYEERILDGEEMIFFLRKNAYPERSLVTIELFPDGCIGQIFRSCNEEPSEEELKFIKEWAKLKNLRVPDVPLRARG